MTNEFDELWIGLNANKCTKIVICQIEERASKLKGQKRQSCKGYYLVSMIACLYE
jgi:hypothetical protein